MKSTGHFIEFGVLDTDPKIIQGLATKPSRSTPPSL
jgi:hypothetical protein